MKGASSGTLNTRKGSLGSLVRMILNVTARAGAACAAVIRLTGHNARHALCEWTYGRWPSWQALQEVGRGWETAASWDAPLLILPMYKRASYRRKGLGGPGVIVLRLRGGKALCEMSVRSATNSTYGIAIFLLDWPGGVPALLARHFKCHLSGVTNRRRSQYGYMYGETNHCRGVRFGMSMYSPPPVIF